MEINYGGSSSSSSSSSGPTPGPGSGPKPSSGPKPGSTSGGGASNTSTRTTTYNPPRSVTRYDSKLEKELADLQERAKTDNSADLRRQIEDIKKYLGR